eukprot:gene3941-7151_t
MTFSDEDEVDNESFNNVLYLITWLQKRDIHQKSKFFIQNSSDEESVKRNVEKLKSMTEIFIKNDEEFFIVVELLREFIKKLVLQKYIHQDIILEEIKKSESKKIENIKATMDHMCQKNYILFGSLSFFLYNLSLHNEINNLNSLDLAKKFTFNEFNEEVLKILIEEFPLIFDANLIIKKLNENTDEKKSKKLQLKLKRKPSYELKKSYSVILSPRKSSENIGPHTPTKSPNLKSPMTPQTPLTPRTTTTHESELSSASINSISPRSIEFVCTEFKSSTIKFQEMWNSNSFILKMTVEEFTEFIFELISFFIVNNLISDRFYYFRLYRKCFIAEDVVKLLPKWKPNIFKSEQIVIDFYQFLLDLRIIEHVVDPEKKFTNQYLFFRFKKEVVGSKLIDKNVLELVHDNFDQFKKAHSIMSSPQKVRYLYEIMFSEQGVQLSDRFYLLKYYNSVFTGEELITWLCKFVSNPNLNRFGSLIVGESLRQLNAFDHVCSDHCLKDEYYFYGRRIEDEFLSKLEACQNKN